MLSDPSGFLLQFARYIRQLLLVYARDLRPGKILPRIRHDLHENVHRVPHVDPPPGNYTVYLWTKPDHHSQALGNQVGEGDVSTALLANPRQVSLGPIRDNVQGTIDAGVSWRVPNVQRYATPARNVA